MTTCYCSNSRNTNQSKNMDISETHYSHDDSHTVTVRGDKVLIWDSSGSKPELCDDGLLTVAVDAQHPARIAFGNRGLEAVIPVRVECTGRLSTVYTSLAVAETLACIYPGWKVSASVRVADMLAQLRIIAYHSNTTIEGLCKDTWTLAKPSEGIS